MGVARPLNALFLGGCLIHRPTRALPDLGEKLRLANSGSYRIVHSFGEMFEIVDILEGRKSIPQSLRQLSGLPLRDRGHSLDLGAVDVAIVEPASPVEITFRGVHTNRSRLLDELRPIQSQNRAAMRIFNKWIRLGLLEMNEGMRTAMAGQLVQLIPADDDKADYRRALILETRAARSDIAGGFRKLRDLLHCPIGAVVYTFRYMPDGRPVGWPPGFREEVIQAATGLGLPIFDAAPLVAAYGVEAAMNASMGHYTDRFAPIIAEELVKFAQSVYCAAHEPQITASPA